MNFTICKFCNTPMRWATTNGKWHPVALDGGRHECKLGIKGKPVPRLKPHQKLNRASLHVDNEDQLLRILSDKPLS